MIEAGTKYPAYTIIFKNVYLNRCSSEEGMIPPQDDLTVLMEFKTSVKKKL